VGRDRTGYDAAQAFKKGNRLLTHGAGKSCDYVKDPGKAHVETAGPLFRVSGRPCSALRRRSGYFLTLHFVPSGVSSRMMPFSSKLFLISSARL